jgi:hypothetical protein
MYFLIYQLLLLLATTLVIPIYASSPTTNTDTSTYTTFSNPETPPVYTSQYSSTSFFEQNGHNTVPWPAYTPHPTPLAHPRAPPPSSPAFLR